MCVSDKKKREKQHDSDEKREQYGEARNIKKATKTKWKVNDRY